MHLCSPSNNAFRTVERFSPSNLGAGYRPDPHPDLVIVSIVSVQQVQTEVD